MGSLVVVIPPDNPRSHVASALTHLDRLVNGTRWQVKPVFLEDDADDASGWPWMADGVLPKGVIWYYARLADLAMIESIAGAGIPIVTYNRDFRSIGASGVVADVTDVARRQFEALWNAGRRRFAVLGVERPSPSIRQYCCTISAEASTRGTIDQFQHVRLHYSATQRPNERMMARINQLMSQPQRPDAVLCADLFSFRGLELWLATNRQVRVPEDLSVATFDPVPFNHSQRLGRSILAGMMDEGRMLAEALKLIERKLVGDLLEPVVVSVPALMADSVPQTPGRPRRVCAA